MSTEPDVHRTAHAVLTHLANQTQPGPHIRNETAWRRKVRSDLRHQHWATLVAILEPNHDDQIATIAQLIRPPNTDPTSNQQAAFNAIVAENERLRTEDQPGVAMPERVREALAPTSVHPTPSISVREPHASEVAS